VLAGKDSIYIEQIIGIAHEAGKIILKIYNSDNYNQVEKSDFSPLTKADIESHNIIVKQLQKITPDVPILSEESAYISWDQRKKWREYWLIDPLDGTKEFIKKNGEFTVNIALIKDNKPALGVVYAPVLGTTWTGEEGKPAKKIVNGESSIIKVKRNEQNKKLIIVGSRSHASKELIEFCNQYDDYNLISMGSSIKLCMVADGTADIYPRLGLTSEWDVAAAHAVVNSAKGEVMNLTTKESIRYNTKESLLNSFFIVSSSYKK
jgi:3'(2'), 5'-bisphosphate nucleotidase